MPTFLVQLPVADLHKEPEPSSETVSQAIIGDEIALLSHLNDWSFVQMKDGYTGWMRKDAYMEVMQKPQFQHRVASLFACLYQTPSISQHPPIMTLPFYAPVQLTGKNSGNWEEIKVASHTLAWINKYDIQKVRQLSYREMLELSRRFVGLPYRWGGTTSFGLDCSGFVQLLFKQIGVLLPRDSYQQADSPLLQAVEINSRQAGDLLFYGRNKRITHVGLYLDHDTLIHAKASLTIGAPAVHMNSIVNPPWVEECICARRLR